MIQIQKPLSGLAKNALRAPGWRGGRRSGGKKLDYLLAAAHENCCNYFWIAQEIRLFFHGHTKNNGNSSEGVAGTCAGPGDC